MKKQKLCKFRCRFFGCLIATLLFVAAAPLLHSEWSTPLSQAVQAQEVEAGSPAVDLDLNGVTASEIEKRYGKPDRKVKSGPSNEMWYFDRSVVFFTSDQVVGWTHPEDLLKREIDAFKYSKQNAESGEQHGWRNAWTREPLNVDTSEILDELLSDAAQKNTTQKNTAQK